MANICLNELSNYNTGELIFKRFDLEDYTCAAEYHEDVQSWLKTCPPTSGYPCEEWNIADCEDVPSKFVGEYHFDAEGYYKYVGLVEAVGDAEVVEAYFDLMIKDDPDADDIQSAYCTTLEARDDQAQYAEIGEYYIEEGLGELHVPDELRDYFNYERYGFELAVNSLDISGQVVFFKL